MAIKNPICLYQGELRELQTGDTLNGVPGGTGGTASITQASLTYPLTNLLNFTSVFIIDNVSSSVAILYQRLTLVNNSSSHLAYLNIINISTGLIIGSLILGPLESGLLKLDGLNNFNVLCKGDDMHLTYTTITSGS